MEFLLADGSFELLIFISLWDIFFPYHIDLRIVLVSLTVRDPQLESFKLISKLSIYPNIRDTAVFLT